MDDITIKTTQSTASQTQDASSASQSSGTPVPTGASTTSTADQAQVQAPNPLQPASLLDKYTVPLLIKQNYPNLPELILQTESMSEEEREYWFQIMPIMTEDQIEKLRTILITEKEQLAKLDKEYEEELNKLNEKHMLEWKEFESKERREKLKTQETANRQEEQNLEEELLAKLNAL